MDDFIAEAKPEDKMNYIRRGTGGLSKLVAMMGDGTNDAPAFGTGQRRGSHEQRYTGGKRSLSNMVDLDKTRLN